MAATIEPTSATYVYWGIDATSPSYGELQRFTKGKGGTQKTFKDKSGEIQTLVTYDKHVTVEFTVLAASSATLPRKGEKVTLFGSDFYVESAREDWKNEDAAQITISARTFET